MNLAVFIADYVTATLLLLLLPHLQTPSATNSPQQRCAAHGSPAVLRCWQSCQQIFKPAPGQRLCACVCVCECMHMHVHLCAFVLLLYPTVHPLPTRFSSSDSKLKLLLPHLSPPLPFPRLSLTVCNANALKIACGHQLSYTYIVYSTYMARHIA